MRGWTVANRPAVEAPSRVTPDKVRWRRTDFRRDWLFCTPGGQMCLLLHSEGVARRIG